MPGGASFFSSSLISSPRSLQAGWKVQIAPRNPKALDATSLVEGKTKFNSGFPSGASDLGTTTPHVGHLAGRGEQKGNIYTHTTYKTQDQSDTETEFVSKKSTAVARLTGRSWDRRVRIVEVRGIRGHRRTGTGVGSPYELTNVELSKIEGRGFQCSGLKNLERILSS